VSSPSFSWSPSGSAIYLERAYQDSENIWRMSVDPQKQRATAIERLTTGPGSDVQLALSPDGRKLAFTARTQQVRTWLFPFDATRGRITGSGQPVTSSGLQAWTPDLSADGRKLVFFSDRHGKLELREALMSEGREIAIPVTNTRI
jgi:Tol biopolymer transport system component